jgi:hypothetical protein
MSTWRRRSAHLSTHLGISRRRLLRGALGTGLVGLWLPPLAFLAPRTAHADSLFPQRFGIWSWGNGNLPDLWTPTGEGAEFDMNEQMLALDFIRHKLAVVTGYSVKVPNIMPHTSGSMGFLTGQEPLGTDAAWQVAGPTIDQILAKELGDATVYRSLEFGVADSESNSWSDPTTNNPAEHDPFAMYERLFGETFREPGEGGVVDPSLGYRRSALDAVMEDVTLLQSELGADDAQRLEQHLDSVRDLELRLAKLQEDPPELEACERPEAPATDYPDIDGRPDLSGRARAMAHLAAMALACDQTRVMTFAFSHDLDRTMYPGASDNHHSLTHNEGTPQPEVNAITKLIIDELAYFLSVVDSVPEGEGTLLDNCALICTSEISEGRTHSLDEFPFVLAGSAGGKLANGVHIRSHTQENVNMATLAVVRALGVNLAEWGDGDSLTGDSLSALEV